MFFVLLHLDGEQWFFILFLFDIQRNRIYLHHHEKNSNHVIAHGGVHFILYFDKIKLAQNPIFL